MNTEQAHRSCHVLLDEQEHNPDLFFLLKALFILFYLPLKKTSKQTKPQTCFYILSPAPKKYLCNANTVFLKLLIG